MEILAAILFIAFFLFIPIGLIMLLIVFLQRKSPKTIKNNTKRNAIGFIIFGFVAFVVGVIVVPKSDKANDEISRQEISVGTEETLVNDVKVKEKDATKTEEELRIEQEKQLEKERVEKEELEKKRVEREEIEKAAEEEKIRLDEERKKQEEQARIEQLETVEEEVFETEWFQNCTELRKVYPDGVAEDHPAYQSKMDRDDDGYACES